MKDKAAKAAYDRARRARLYVDKRPKVCSLDGCDVRLVQPRHGYRLFCSDAHKLAAFYERNPDYEAGRDRGYATSHPSTREPMPMAYVGHEVFEQAAKAARLSQSVAYGVDWGQNDIMGEAVLAILEGRDPDEAVRKHRAHEKALTAMRAYPHDVGWDGKRVVVQWYGTGEER